MYFSIWVTESLQTLFASQRYRPRSTRRRIMVKLKPLSMFCNHWLRLTVTSGISSRIQPILLLQVSISKHLMGDASTQEQHDNSNINSYKYQYHKPKCHSHWQQTSLSQLVMQESCANLEVHVRNASYTALCLGNKISIDPPRPSPPVTMKSIKQQIIWISWLIAAR